jgi:hypothetical protein
MEGFGCCSVRPDSHTGVPDQQAAEILVLPRLLKKVQMQGAKRSEVRGVLSLYGAAPRERGNEADGPF